MHKVDRSSLANFLLGRRCWPTACTGCSCGPKPPLGFHPWVVLLYPVYVLCGVAILYSLMISLAATSIWLGRNQTLYDFWFYITNFSRYPMEIYSGRWGSPLRWAFTYLIPVLIVVNVPARLVALPLHPENAWLCLFALAATGGSLLASRALFLRALESYRSASS
ncbi:MAG: ABC-2 family transporter protein [Pirellulales bacterium]